MTDYIVDTAILGAGFAGIGAAYSIGKEAEIFEKDDTWGGLCGNFEINGFRFDKAVHLSFVKEDVVKKIFYGTPYYEHFPESKNYIDGYWVRHPLQNNCCKLPVEERIKIIKSFIERTKENVNPKNYKEWLNYQFGTYFSETYPERYTRKYWGVNAEELSTSWCGGRLYQPSLDEVLRGAFTDETPNTYYAKKMYYPQKGGYRAFVTSIAEKCTIHYGKKVVAIDTVNKEIYFDDNTRCKYINLISTLPLPSLVSVMDKCPKDILKTSEKLEATKMTLVSIGFNKKIDIPSLWFYVYDEDIPFARAYSPSMKSPDNVPEGKSSLQCEIYSSIKKPLKISDSEIKEKVLFSLTKMHIAENKDIELVDVRHIPFANVIFYNGMEDNRNKCINYVHSKGIHVAGRFGEWDYLWSGQAFMSGYNEGFNTIRNPQAVPVVRRSVLHGQ